MGFADILFNLAHSQLIMSPSYVDIMKIQMQTLMNYFDQYVLHGDEQKVQVK